MDAGQYIIIDNDTGARHSLKPLDVIPGEGGDDITVQEQVDAYLADQGVTNYQVMTVAAWEDSAEAAAQTLANEWNQIRAYRNTLLQGCDWTQAQDAPLTAQEVSDWSAYRQALRDVPSDQSTATTFNAINWPEPPA